MLLDKILTVRVEYFLALYQQVPRRLVWMLIFMVYG